MFSEISGRIVRPGGLETALRRDTTAGDLTKRSAEPTDRAPPPENPSHFAPETPGTTRTALLATAVGSDPNPAGPA